MKWREKLEVKAAKSKGKQEKRHLLLLQHFAKPRATVYAKQRRIRRRLGIDAKRYARVLCSLARCLSLSLPLSLSVIRMDQNALQFADKRAICKCKQWRVKWSLEWETRESRVFGWEGRGFRGNPATNKDCWTTDKETAVQPAQDVPSLVPSCGGKWKAFAPQKRKVNRRND